MSEDELQRVWILRKLLHDMDDIAAIEFILDKLKETKTNNEFFDSMRNKTYSLSNINTKGKFALVLYKKNKL